MLTGKYARNKQLGRPKTDGRIILWLIRVTVDVTLWAGLTWLAVIKSDCLLLELQWAYGIHKMLKFIDKLRSYYLH
jgi:hypothetical protein